MGEGAVFTDTSVVDDFRLETQQKIEYLLDQFSRGKVNREQFQAVYAHYHEKLESAEAALLENDASLISDQPGRTFDILQAHTAKPLGFMIYHNRSGLYIDTLGDFDIAPSRIAPALNDFTDWMECNREIEPLIERIGEKEWVLFTGGSYTTVISLFHNDPSASQSGEIGRLHHDFEIANHNRLDSKRVNASKLGYPFLAYLQEKIGART